MIKVRIGLFQIERHFCPGLIVLESGFGLCRLVGGSPHLLRGQDVLAVLGGGELWPVDPGLSQRQKQKSYNKDPHGFCPKFRTAMIFCTLFLCLEFETIIAG